MSHPTSTSSNTQLVAVGPLKLYREVSDDSGDFYELDIRELNPPYTRPPARIPRILIERLDFSHDRTLVLCAIMERWVAEQNHFPYEPLA